MRTLSIILSLSLGQAIASAKSDEYITILIQANKHSPETVKRIKKYAPTIVSLSEKLKVKPELSLSIAWTESHFKPYAISYTGDIGIMQVRPQTQDYIIKKIVKTGKYNKIYRRTLKNSKLSYKIIDNLFIGILYLKYLNEKFDHDKKRVIVSYNRGPTGTRKLIRDKFPLTKVQYYRKVNNKIKHLNKLGEI